MLIFLLVAGLVAVLAAVALRIASVWSSIPRSNADFQWLDV